MNSERATRARNRFDSCLVIVPAFNERRALPGVLFDLRSALPDVAVVVVDDGSDDGTADVVPPWATLLRLPFNMGIGAAMQTGYRYAAAKGYQVAVQVDGDGQHAASEVARLLERMAAGDVDLVIGSRFVGDSAYRQTAARGVGAVLLRTVIRAVSGITLTDCTSGFRAANRRVIEAFAHWYPDDYPEPEVVATLAQNGCVVAEVPVRMRPRRHGKSSITLADGLLYVLKVSVALLLDRFRNPWSAHLGAVDPIASRSVAGPAEATLFSDPQR